MIKKLLLSLFCLAGIANAQQWIDPNAFVRRDGSRALTANWDAGSFQIRAETFFADVATGTAPLTVNSTTKVTNLNADLLDGLDSGAWIKVDGTSTTTAPIPFAQGIRLNDGSVSNPSLSFTSSTDTGIFSLSNNLYFAVDGETIISLIDPGFSSEYGMRIEKYGVRIMTSGQPFTFGTDYGAPSLTGIVNTGFYISGGLVGGGGLKMYISGAAGDSFDNAGEKVYISGGLDNTLGSGWVQIGTAGVPSHWSTSVGAEDNFFVGGDFEVDGTLFADGALNVVGTTTLATSLTGILKATSGVVATASSSDLLTAIGTIDISSNTNLAVTSPITLTGDTVGIQNAAADGSTKGAATFTAADFNSSAGLISIDYTNGQAASGANKGFLTSADWTTFNNKVATTRTINTTSPITGGGDLSADRTLAFDQTANFTWSGTHNFSVGLSVTSGQKVYLEGAGSDTYFYYDSGSSSIKFYVNGALAMELK